MRIQNLMNAIIVGANGIVREGIKAILQNCQPNINVVGEASEGQEVFSLTKRYDPDLLVVDLLIPKVVGIEVIKYVLKDKPNIKVIALSDRKDISYVLEMFESGVHGYALSDCVDDIIEAIGTVITGNCYLSFQLNISIVDLLTHLNEFCKNGKRVDLLSLQERQILQMIAEGKDVREIANLLSRSHKTVKSHRKKVMDKLNLYSVADLTRYAIREGMISLE